ncbi:DoxX family protein [Hellea sp.]|nr:DoxX family protein [Hellea sp.]
MARVKIALCWLFALFFFVAGIMHFVQDDSFAAIVPPVLPFPKLIVWVTGVMELVFAVGLVLPKYRKAAGFWLAPYLLAVLPANIYMAMHNIPLGDMAASPTALWVRVALQFPLIALILWASGNIGRRQIST